MATVNETIKASRIFLLDQNGGITEQTSASVTAETEAKTGYKGTFKEAHVIFDLASSTNASRYKVQSINAAPSIKASAKDLTYSSVPTRSPFLPDGAAVAADFDVQKALEEFSTVVQNTFQSISLSGWTNLPYKRNESQLDARLAFVVGSSGNVWSSTDYTGKATASFAGVGTTDAPKVGVTWGDVVPVISGRNIGNGAFVNEKAATTFSWNIANLFSENGTPINATTVMKWREKDSSTVQTVNATNNSVTIPANTFSNGTYEWAVLCTTEYGQSNTEVWTEFTTTDAVPLAPTINSPVNSIVRVDETTRFSWAANNPNGTPQTKADLQYSTDLSSWTTLATVTGADEFKDIASGTLPAGTLYWRVRTYNTDNTAGPWSEAAEIIGKGTPSAPIIVGLETTPRASVTWQHGSQVGWRVVFTDSTGKTFDSGDQYGSAKTFRSPGYLADGPALVTVSVANADGEWNSTTETFDVSNVMGSGIGLSANQDTAGNVSLNWSTGGTFDAFFVLRNGTPIARTTETSYTDRNANGEAIYQIRGAIGSNYTDSEPVTITIRTKVATIRPLDGDPIALFIRRGVPAAFSINRTASVAYQHFAGVEYPSAFDSGFRDLSFSINVTVKNENVADVAALIGKLAVLKDKTGLAIFAVVDSVEQSTARWSEIVINLTRVEYQEAVAYD